MGMAGLLKPPSQGLGHMEGGLVSKNLTLFKLTTCSPMKVPPSQKKGSWSGMAVADENTGSMDSLPYR